MTRPPSPAPLVAAAIATHKRDRELRRLLECLAASAHPLDAGAFVADNASSPETRDLCAAAPLPCTWIPRAENNGPAAAWNAAVAAALENPSVTHLLVLDDDVVPPPQTVGDLLETIKRAHAAAAAPLLFDAANHLWGLPEPADRTLRAVIRRLQTPDECRAVLGPGPHAFCWATGACMLYARAAFEGAGFFREDFWMLGEDLEFSMRVAATMGGVFTARVAVPHLPPAPHDPRAAQIAHRGKFLALLQNLSYLAFHSAHSAHLRWYLPGNFRRFLLTEGLAPGNLRDAAAAFRLGALGGCPAGAACGARLRDRAAARMREAPR